MRGLTALGGRGFKAIVVSLSALGLLFIFGSFLEEAAPYAKEISETGFYPAHDYDAPSAEPLLPPEVTTLSDEDHPATAKWHSDAMAKIKDKIGSWLPMEKVYGAMIPPPWRDHSKSMKPSSYHAPEPPKEEHSVIVGKVSILNNPENEYIDRAVRTHTVHDKRHGYQHYIMREQLSSNAYENFATHMLSVLQAELSKLQPERLEWLYYFPETTIILNPNVPLELFLPPNENSTLASRHLLYPERTTTSTSPPPDLAHTVFAAKIHEWTVDLFTTLVSRATTATEQTQHHDPSSSSNTVMPLPSLLALPPPLSPADHALALPTHWLNCWPPSIPLAAAPSAPTLSHTDPADPDTGSTSGNPPDHQIHRGSFVPANSTAEEGGRWRDGGENSVVLARRFEHWLARAEARLPLWEAPLEETWYVEEARGFWEGRAAASSSYASASGGIASPVGYVDPGYTPATGGEGESKGGHSPRVEKLKEEAAGCGWGLGEGESKTQLLLRTTLHHFIRLRPGLRSVMSAWFCCKPSLRGALEEVGPYGY
ncbi:hypothetical protein B0J12DRAFT_32696 [Macrophomina phaseolina]|uniref:Uncharacterized protein n=1 Tax=Macrophomina phaseolina TaxID=35725 RepID=A0ABQ8GVS0_9PEZI|nr:hypothetical protein B0J12DRAFT_32696 [Macrophomina phaseolina]